MSTASGATPALPFTVQPVVFLHPGIRCLETPLLHHAFRNAIEVANGLWMAERRGRIQSADIPRVLALLDPLPIAVRSTAHEHARREVLELARRERLTCYAAAYLERAMREGLPLATRDTQLQAAARRTGVPLFTD